MATQKPRKPRKTTRVRSAVAARKEQRFGAVELFYAQAIAIEREAAARYREFAHQMAGYGNTATAELFMRLARFESEHAERLLETTAGMTLPSIEQVRHDMAVNNRSEVATYEFLYRRVLPHHALLMALSGERRAKAYFERVGKTSKDPGIRKLAKVFAGEEKEHIAWLEKALEAEPQTVHRFDDLED